MTNTADSKRLIVATDPGLDDALAILWLLEQPNVSIEGVVAVAGNVNAQESERNAVWLLQAAGREDIPIYSTSDIAQNYENLPHIMGPDGIGGFALETITGNKSSWTELKANDCELLALGPATVPAQLIASRHFKNVTWMGGVIDVAGNAPDGGECNSSADLRATEQLLTIGQSLRVVPLDVTRQVWFDLTKPIEQIDFLYDESELFTKVARRYCELAQARGAQRAHPHDLVAAVACINTEKFVWQQGSATMSGSRLQVGDDGPLFGIEIESLF